MVSPVFKTVCGAVTPSWVGSIPTRSRHSKYKGFQPFVAESLLYLLMQFKDFGDRLGDRLQKTIVETDNADMIKCFHKLSERSEGRMHGF